MSITINLIFGQEQVCKVINNEALSNEEQKINLKSFSFNTIEEKNAFCAGINEAVGWQECFIQES
jgi:hypothetical protein